MNWNYDNYDYFRCFGFCHAENKYLINQKLSYEALSRQFLEGAFRCFFFTGLIFLISLPTRNIVEPNN